MQMHESAQGTWQIRVVGWFSFGNICAYMRVQDGEIGSGLRFDL